MSSAEHLKKGIDIDVQELIAMRLSSKGASPRHRSSARSSLTGQHSSRFRGRGVDYLESRLYQPGDDVRNMDWRITARTGEAYTKLFREERQRSVFLLMDTSASMFFGTRTRLKSVQAARMASLLAWATIQHGDRIAAMAFGGPEHHEMPPSGGRRGIMRLVRNLRQWYQPDVGQQTTSREPLDEALKRARRIARPGSLLVIFSDFTATGDECERHINRLKLHNDILLIRILDPVEIEAPGKAVYPVSNGQGFASLDLSNTRRQQNYSHWHRERQKPIEEIARRMQLPLLDIQTHSDARALLNTIKALD